MTDRSASADWHGDARTGSGSISVGNGVFEGPFSAQSRFGEDPGTNPEQLIAAGLAGCYTMALSNLLGVAGHRPKRLRTTANVQLRFVDGNAMLARIDLNTEGEVYGLDQDGFAEYARQAKVACPVSRALAGIPEITLAAQLAQAASATSGQ
jgi:osmotically inducible protein OsmC